MLQHDLESYSCAGFIWDEAAGKWRAPHGSKKKGLPVVGANAYWEHPTAKVLVMRYRWSHWPEGVTSRWLPGEPCPPEIAEWTGPIEAHNNMFERLAWHHVLTPQHGFPEPDPSQWHCSAATARVNALPGGLERLGAALDLDTRKDAEGKRLMRKFSMPRDRTLKDDRTRVMPADDPVDFAAYDDYCATDVLVEAEAMSRMAPMTPDERRYWLIDQEINWRGIAIDRAGVRDCIAVMDETLARYDAECRGITGGLGPSQVTALLGWINGRLANPQRDAVLADEIPY